MRTSRTTTALAATGCLVVATFAACSEPAAPSDRTGGDTLTLRLATSDGEGVGPVGYEGPRAFVDALDEVSGGRIQVELAWDFASGAADAETQLVAAIAAGDVDGGWPATRAFARAGIEGLEAVEAPMLLSSEAAVDELVEGDAAEAVLAQLDGTGLTGLGLMAAPLRRPVGGAAPLVAAADWQDATFRVYNSPVQAAAVRALGGRPVDMTHAWTEAMRIGDLDGAEIDLMAQSMVTGVHHVTGNVVLWPKVHVTAVNATLFDSLTDQQQAWVQEAADRAREASVAASYDGALDLQPLCDQGVQVHEATGADLDGLRAAVAPVLDDLRTDPESAELMGVVEALAAAHPDPDVPEPTGGCDGAGGDAGGLPETVPPIEDGTYRTEIPAALTDDVGNGAGWSGTWTVVVEDGTYAVTCRPLELPGVDCGHTQTDDVLEAGSLRGDGTDAWFVPSAEALAEYTGCQLPSSEDDPDACIELAPYGATWRQDGDTLVFEELLADEAYHLTLAPWRRIG